MIFAKTFIQKRSGHLTPGWEKSIGSFGWTRLESFKKLLLVEFFGITKLWDRSTRCLSRKNTEFSVEVVNHDTDVFHQKEVTSLKWNILFVRLLLFWFFQTVDFLFVCDSFFQNKTKSVERYTSFCVHVEKGVQRDSRPPFVAYVTQVTMHSCIISSTKRSATNFVCHGKLQENNETPLLDGVNYEGIYRSIFSGKMERITQNSSFCQTEIIKFLRTHIIVAGLQSAPLNRSTK